MFVIGEKRFYKLDKKRPGTYIKPFKIKKGKFTRRKNTPWLGVRKTKKVTKQLVRFPVYKQGKLDIKIIESYTSPVVNYLNQWLELMINHKTLKTESV